MSATNALPAGAVSQVAMFWTLDSTHLDTIGWPRVHEAILDTPTDSGATMRSSLEAFRNAGTTVYRLEKPTAITLAILKDIGASIVVLSQWRAFPANYIRINHPGFDDEYKKRLILSDFLWERLDDYTARRPVKLEKDFTLTLYFDNMGQSQYSGAENPEHSQAQILGTDGLVLEFENEKFEDVLVKRRIDQTYAIMDADLKPAAIIRRIERAMDKMKLDLSYTAPGLIAVQ